MKKKILHVINSITIGGAEILLANSLSPGGMQEHTDNIVAYFKGTSHIEKRIDKSIPVYPLHYTGVASLLSTLAKLRRIMNEQKVDIVHSHLNPTGLYTHWICPKDIPQIHTVHTTYSMDTEARPLLRFMEKHLYFMKKNSNIILLSEFTKKDFLESVPFKGKTFVLNNFVHDSFFKDTKTGYEKGRPLKLVAAGSLKELKNFEYLLSVFTFLKDIDVSLDIYGIGDASKYNDFINAEKINVRMMGFENDLSDIFHRYDVFIMPSLFEGFPLSLFEAMASGVPVMLSDIPPLKSIVKENGIYFQLDNPGEVANTIRAIYNNEIPVNAMAGKAREFADTIARREIYIQKLLKIYDELINLHGRN